MGKQWKQCQTLFFWAPKSLQMVTAAMKLKDADSLLSQRGHLCCLSLWYGLWFSCQDSWPLGPAAPKPPLPCLTSRLLPSACCPQPQCCYPVLPASPLLPSSCQALPALFPCSRPGSSVGHSPAHTSSPARHAHVPVPHRLHGPQMHPAGVCRLLCQQQHLHGQPGQPAPVPMPARLPGGSLPVP